MCEEPHDKEAAGTLGDVLYANQPPTVVVEQEWDVLVERIAERDQVALHALYERTYRIVFTLIMRIVRSRETAEELTVDVFHDVWRRASTYERTATGTVIGWIMNQARSRAIDRLRHDQRKKRVDPYPDAVDGEVSPSAVTMIESEQRSQLLRAAMAVLTNDEKEAIDAAFFGSLSHAEVAEQLNQPLGTIKTRIRSGIQKLRNELTTEGEP